MERRDHWNTVYTTKTEQQVSWFEPLPSVSLRMLTSAGVNAESCVLDVGGGDSRLVDALLTQGLECIAVLDVSGAALDRAKARVGPKADSLMWIESDVTAPWSLKPMDVWHDRAVFHFLTDETGRSVYRNHLLRILKPGGTAIIATFAPDGPEKCSGLAVARYSPEALAVELGAALRLIESQPHTHTTPWGATQSFQYSRFIRQ
jgi:SAM-dependent methyltransferase